MPQKMYKGKLFLLDAYALIFRAYYAFINRQMINSKGVNTSAIFGFTVALEEILKNQKPSHIAVVFDPPSPTFRHIMYSEYKANREETPEEIKSSVPFIKEIIKGFNIPIVEVEGYEADDVIGTLSKQAEDKGYLVYMMTPDKDYSQLVSENIFMYKPKRSGEEAEIIGPDEIKNLFHVENPQQVIDVLALWGDSSDNVPGAPGIGEKTAKKLISEFKSVENLLSNTDKLQGKLKESLEKNKQQVELSKKLVTIKLDVPVNFDDKSYQYRGFDKKKLSELFDDLEFRTIKNRILQNEDITGTQESPAQGLLFSQDGEDTIIKSLYKTIQNTEHSYNLCDTPHSIKHLVTLLKNQSEFCFDTETTNINPLIAELVGIAFSFRGSEAYYVPFPEDQRETLQLLREFESLFQDSSITIIGQNLKYDMQVLNNYGIRIKSKIFDTMIAHYLIQPELKHNLNYLAESYLNYSPVSIEALIGKKGSEQGNMRNVPLEQIKEYSGEDADLTMQLSLILRNKLQEENLVQLAEMVEFPLIQVLAHIEAAGVNLDIDFLKKYSLHLNDELQILEKEIYDLSGMEFNISSPKQLGEILFDKLKIQVDAKRTKTKIYSTSEETLAKLVNTHPVINKVLEYRTLKKLLSTYIEALPKLINQQTKKLHTSFNQAITSTGRLSSNNPNLQNIPIREQRGREIRKAFIPSGSEYIIFAADYSQIELRLMAHMSQDENMQEAFHNGEDIHQATASHIFDLPLEKVTREMRNKAKTANFGIIYGISAFGLSQRLNISRTEAKDLIDGYFRSYPAVKKYMDKSIQSAKEKSYVETLLGRRRYLKDIHSRNAVVRGFAERNAINAPIQGSAADIIKIAMININRIMVNQDFRSRMILQVHDELVFDVYKPELEQLITIVKNGMENAYKLSIPLVIDYGIGDNWLEAH